MTTPLSKLLAEGLEGARIVFGADGIPVSAGRLAEAGTALFSSTADVETVGVLMTNDQPTVELVLGAVATGATVVSLPVPSRGADLREYASFLANVCRFHGVHEVVVSDEVADLIDAWAQQMSPRLSAQFRGIDLRRHSELRKRPLAAPSDEGFRLVQFSSGSTNLPKPVVMDDAALGANVAAVLEAVRPRPGDVAVSWLPLSHDMGLVGMLLVGIAAAGPQWAGGGPIVLLDPAAFLRRPALWLETVSFWRGSVTAAPDFGYRLATRRRPPDTVNLSSLRCAIVGGEIVRSETLEAFTATFGDDGLDPGALCPAYGMAELGVAAAMTPLDEQWRTRTLSTLALADGQLTEPGEGEPSVTLVASGPAIPGYEIRCTAPEALAGGIEVRGPSLGVDGATGSGYAGPDGWYRTDDSGFVSGDWLYVCGRADDHIVAHGRNLYAPAIEAAVAETDGIRSGRAAAAGLPNGDWVVVAEPAGDEPMTTTRADALLRGIRLAAARVASAQPDQVVLVERGSLPMTPSGKLQRHEVRRRFLLGGFQGPGRTGVG